MRSSPRKKTPKDGARTLWHHYLQCIPARQRPDTHKKLHFSRRYSRSQRVICGKPSVVVIPIHTSRGRPMY